MIIPAIALVAYRRRYPKNDEDADKSWKELLAEEVATLQRPLRKAVLRFHGSNYPSSPMVIMDPPSFLVDESSSSCFSSRARIEWIKAVFGKSLQQPKGSGLAMIAEYTSSKILIPPQTNKLGITIQRLTLGLYVRSIKEGSEASIVGVLPDSVLVSINEICLLAEPSKHALERLWQYEGQFTDVVESKVEKSNSTNNNMDTELVIQHPVQMTFIRHGELYSVLFLCNPPFGIEWAPCGNFALVKRNEGSHHNIPRGAIVLSVNNQEDLDHTKAAQLLREAVESDTSIDLILGWPPSASRSGHWERQQEQKQQYQAQNNTKSPQKSIPIYTQQHNDGVQVKYHSLFTTGGPPIHEKGGIRHGGQDISQLAGRVTTGQILPSFSKKEHYYLLSKVYHPCPTLDGQLLANWDIHQALLFILKSYWIMMNNNVSTGYGDDAQIYPLDSYENLIRLCQSSYKTGMKSAVLFPLVACSYSCQNMDDKGLFNILVQLAKEDRFVAPTIELLAMSTKHSTLQEELQRIRLDRGSKELSVASEEKKMPEEDEMYNRKNTRNRFLSSFRRKKRSSRKQKQSNNSVDVFEEEDVYFNGCSRETLLSYTLDFVKELEGICQDIEKSLLRSFPQRLAGWALQPWSASNESELAKVTETMRERLANCLYRQLLNPLNSSEVIVDLDPAESYILPSAHFPLLLTFQCQTLEKHTSMNQGKSNGGSFGQEELYRTEVEMVNIQSTQSVRNRKFVLRASVAGTIKESAKSITLQDPNKQVWEEGNILVFDNWSSWGAPQTLALRLSEALHIEEGDEPIIDGSGYQNDIGMCWVDLTPIWDEAIDTDTKERTVTCHAEFLPTNATGQFDDHGELPSNLDGVVERVEITLKVSNKIVSSAGPCCKRSLLYKHDDDVRQEMFAIEFIKACDSILKSCGLDLKLITFQCIPVGENKGFIEWVHGSVPLSEICQPFANSFIGRKRSSGNNSSDDDTAEDPKSSAARAGLTKYKSLEQSRDPNLTMNPVQDYLRSFAYDPDSPYLIHKDAMDAYIKSCAGYCAITYILGVGDRHLDNLLLHQSGHFFHCDYSYILGSDPKKYLPVRISEEMVNGMGGKKSDNYVMFLALTCAAFLTLRRPENARYLLSLVRSMEGSLLPDLEQNQSMEAAILGIRNRLRFDLSEDQAITFMEKMIEDSCSSKMWIAVDAIHTLGKRF